MIKKDDLFLNRNSLFKFRTIISRISRRGGRNNSGKITVRHRGGGMRSKFYNIDNYKGIFGQIGVIKEFKKVTSHSGSNALVFLRQCGLVFYMLCSESQKSGDRILLSRKNKQDNDSVFGGGFHLRVGDINIGTAVCSVESKLGHGSQFVKAAGTFSRVLGSTRYKNRAYVSIKLPSQKIIYINEGCMVTIGRVSVVFHQKYKLNKAGSSRLLGRRPRVRGVAMNPVDHPHGGDTSGGRISVSKWGFLTKGFKTTKPVKKKKRIFLLKRLRGKAGSSKNI
jgi:large subunit ribosomal protein L2